MNERCRRGVGLRRENDNDLRQIGDRIHRVVVVPDGAKSAMMMARLYGRPIAVVGLAAAIFPGHSD